MAEKIAVTITGLMTAPRHEITWARTQIEAALHEVGIPLLVSGGVFYGQCMQRMLTEACEQGTQYALTLDYDSIFTAAHVHRLLGLITHREEIDAICALQPKRGNGAVLGSNGRKEDVIWDGNPVRIASGHFGLTIIDLQKLAEVPKPWFHASPNEDGDWDGSKIDDDVGFWLAWNGAGHSLYCDPGCRLGHYEEMVTVFDNELHRQHYYPRDWLDTHAAKAVG